MLVLDWDTFIDIERYPAPGLKHTIILCLYRAVSSELGLAIKLGFLDYEDLFLYRLEEYLLVFLRSLGIL
jgi:hypothetical protein